LQAELDRLWPVAEVETVLAGGRPATTANRRLQAVVSAFTTGYRAATFTATPDLGDVPRDLRGFAVEGAAMSFTLQGALEPPMTKLHDFAAAVPAHSFLVSIGAGVALGRLGRTPPDFEMAANPELGYILYDGWGFYEALFHSRRFLERRAVPQVDTESAAARAFDQGLGRGIWFRYNGDVRSVVESVSGFVAERRPDIWSGLGFAAAYAGGIDDASAVRLAAASDRVSAAVGASLATAVRLQSDESWEVTERIATAFSAVSPDHSLSLLARARATATGADVYLEWRDLIRRSLSPQTAPGSG